MAMDWEEVRRADLARREERRARKNGNGQQVVASRDESATPAVPSRTKIREEIFRLQGAKDAERIAGAHALRQSLRGQPGLERLLRAAERLTCVKPPSRLFG